MDCEDEIVNDDSQIDDDSQIGDDIIVDNCDSSENDSSSSSSYISKTCSTGDSGGEDHAIEENSISEQESVGSKRRNDDTLMLSHHSLTQNSHLSFKVNSFCLFNMLLFSLMIITS